LCAQQGGVSCHDRGAEPGEQVLSACCLRSGLEAATNAVCVPEGSPPVFIPIDHSERPEGRHQHSPFWLVNGSPLFRRARGCASGISERSLTRLIPAHRHPPVPAAGERQGRAVPADPPRRVGLRPALPVQRGEARHAPGVGRNVQSGQTPHRAERRAAGSFRESSCPPLGRLGSALSQGIRALCRSHPGLDWCSQGVNSVV